MVDSPCIAVTDSQINFFFKSKSCTPCWTTSSATEQSLYIINLFLKQFSRFFKKEPVKMISRSLSVKKNITLSGSAMEPIDFRRQTLNLDNYVLLKCDTRASLKSKGKTQPYISRGFRAVN